MRPLFKKLGLKSSLRADIVNGPEDLFDLLHDMPEDIEWDDESANLNWLLSFHGSKVDFLNSVDQSLLRLKEDASWWVACKKGLPKSETRLGREVMLEALAPYGWVDVLVCSINDEWSGYKFMKRKELRKS